MDKFNVGVLVYNKDIEVIKSINVFKKIKDKVYFLDNSTNEEIKLKNIDYCMKNNFNYIDNKGNIGLPKAYNKFIDIANAEYLIFFDDDTLIDELYFDKVRNELNGINEILIPTVVSNDTQISPSSLQDCKVKKFNNKNITAINTAMIIKKTVYNTVGKYNEEMFLDYVDHEFMRRCNKYKIKIKVLDHKITQSFSGHDFTDKESAKNRFKIFIKDFKVFCTTDTKKIFFYKKKIFLRAMKLSVKFKDFEFYRLTKR